jgi:hypothetical protein
MRIGPFLQRRRPMKRRRLAGAALGGVCLSGWFLFGWFLLGGVLFGSVLSGCVFELADLAPLGAGGAGAGAFGGSSMTGAGATPSGSSGMSGSGMSDSAGDPCGSSEKRCDGVCTVMSPANGCGNTSCAPCAPLAQTIQGCTSDSPSACKVERCEPGFADCDGDVITDVGTLAGNGCEYSFGTIADSADPLVVPRARIQLTDASRDDWSGLPAYELGETCVDCVDDVTVFQPTAQNEAPSDSDLSAYFRVAWDGDFFYVLAEAFDDHVFNAGATVDNGACQTNGNYVPGSMCEDAFVLYFDGRQDGGNYGNEDHRIFIGTSGTFFAPAQGQPPSGSVAMQLLPSNGPLCYRMEAQFDWRRLVSNQGEAVAGKFPPAAGQTYGFDIAASDWDPAVSDASTFERQSQLFWTARAPGSKLHPSIAGVGSIVLSDDSSSGDPQSPQ